VTWLIPLKAALYKAAFGFGYLIWTAGGVAGVGGGAGKAEAWTLKTAIETLAEFRGKICF
jgi:hypothetical protein